MSDIIKEYIKYEHHYKFYNYDILKKSFKTFLFIRNINSDLRVAQARKLWHELLKEHKKK